mgnify:CR=1 FL=1
MGPFDGVRIVDLTTMISGPFATMLLGDQGADVVKIERPDGGDEMRHWGRQSGPFSAPFVNNNRSKRSVAINLKEAAGREVVKRLVSTADVFVQNFRPGVMARLGLADEILRPSNPRLIYVSISGFGDTGPLASKPAYDPVFQAASGLASLQGGSDLARPRMVRAMLPDKLAALNAAQAISAALYVRERTGTGQHIKLSMLDAVLSFLWSGEMDGHTFLENQVDGPESLPPFDLIYETRDGYICVATVTSAQWAGFAKTVGHPEWLTDPRFATSDAREINRAERLELMQEALRSDTTDTWVEKLEAADVPCSHVHTRREIVHHPHTASSGSLIEFDHAEAGRIRQARDPARFDQTQTKAWRMPPRLGEHTNDVLSEAGYSGEEIEKLKLSGVIA